MHFHCWGPFVTDVEKIRALLAEGRLSTSQIARECGCYPDKVRKLMRQLTAPPPPPPIQFRPRNGTGNWNGARVDLLKKLWADGLTGGQIANRMGGLTRMALIGKARRLGLASRARNERIIGPKKFKLTSGKPPKPTRVNYFAKRAAAIQSLELQPATPLPHVAEPVIPLAERKTILIKDARGRLHANDALTDACCKWGIGDPRDADFHFCGRAVHKSLPYCEAHSRRAFDLPQVRQRERAAAKERIPTFADAETV